MTTATYTVRLIVENNRDGGFWAVATDHADSIMDAARWRNEIRRWCARNPLPPGLEYFVPLPRRINN